jgi:hypothetical protein
MRAMSYDLERKHIDEKRRSVSPPFHCSFIPR